MRIFLILIALLFVLGLAQEGSDSTEEAPPVFETTPLPTTEASDESTTDDAEKRLIVIDSSGGNQSGNLRKGPILYDHPDAEGIKATVSTLSIFSQKAELRTPETAEELTLVQAKGRRIATFTDGVRVSRGRLEATGELLVYNEETGIGLLTGSVSITVAPKEENGEPVFISTLEVEFDVDTDVSISRGNVMVDNGNQQAEADEMEYEEERTLGVLRNDDSQATITREDEDGGLLVITSDEIRILTDEKRLHAIDNVTVVDGESTSTGNEVFFDDAQSLAEIIGNAKYLDEANGVTITGARILQDIEFDFAEAIDESVPSEFNSDDYLLTREQ